MERIKGRLGASKRVISYEKLKWVVSSFQPYKSPGIDGIMPIMLQQGFELLDGKTFAVTKSQFGLRIYSHELKAHQGGIYT